MRWRRELRGEERWDTNCRQVLDRKMRLYRIFWGWNLNLRIRKSIEVLMRGVGGGDDPMLHSAWDDSKRKKELDSCLMLICYLPHTHAFYGEGNGNPLQYSCLENPMDRGAWWAAVHGVIKSQTRLSNFTFTFHFHALEKEMATHSSVLAWRIPGTGEPGGLPSMGSHRVGHNWSNLAAAACLLDC